MIKDEAGGGFVSGQHCLISQGAGTQGASLTLPPHLPSSGAVTPVRMCERRIAVEAGPSRTQTPLSSAGGRASARRCRSRRTKAARCTASWRSTRYRRSPGGTGQLGCGLAPVHCDSRARLPPGDKGQRERRKWLEDERASPPRWPGTSTLPPGRASSSPTCTVSSPGQPGHLASWRAPSAA